jgi:hypothetical protein
MADLINLSQAVAGLQNATNVLVGMRPGELLIDGLDGLADIAQVAIGQLGFVSSLLSRGGRLAGVGVSLPDPY